MPTAGEAEIGPTSHYNLRVKPLPRTKSVVGQGRALATARGKENVQKTTTATGKGPVTRSRSKIPLPSSSSLTTNTRGKTAAKKKTARKGVPDFAKLHKRWQNKFEQVKEFDLTRPGTQFKGAYSDAEGGEGDHHFEVDEMALQSILNERGVAEDSNRKAIRNTIASTEMRPRAPTSVRKTLGSIPVPQSTRPERRQTRGPNTGPRGTQEDFSSRKGRKSMVEQQREMGIEFEADADALESIISNTGIRHARAAAPPASRQTFATSRGMAGRGSSFYGRQSQKRMSIWYQPEQKSAKEVYDAYFNTLVRRLTVGENGPSTVNRAEPGGTRPAVAAPSSVRNSIYRDYPSTSCVKQSASSQARAAGTSAPRATPGRVRAGPGHHLGSSGKPRTPASRVPNPHFHSVLQRQEISSSPMLSGTKPCHLGNTARKKVQWAEATVPIPSAKELATSLFPDQADSSSTEEQRKQMEKKKEMEELERQLELEIEMLSALNDSVMAPDMGAAPPVAPALQVPPHQPAPTELESSRQPHVYRESAKGDTAAEVPPKMAWSHPPENTTQPSCQLPRSVTTVAGLGSRMGYGIGQSYAILNAPREQNVAHFSSSANPLNAESRRAQELAMTARPIAHTNGGMTSLQYSTIGQSNFAGVDRRAGPVVVSGVYTSLGGSGSFLQGSVGANLTGVGHPQTDFHDNLIGTASSQASHHGNMQGRTPSQPIGTMRMPLLSADVRAGGSVPGKPRPGNHGYSMSSGHQWGHVTGPSATSMAYMNAPMNLVPPAIKTGAPGVDVSQQSASAPDPSSMSYPNPSSLQQCFVSSSITSKSVGHPPPNDVLPISGPIHGPFTNVLTHTSGSTVPTSMCAPSDSPDHRSIATVDRPHQEGSVLHQFHTGGQEKSALSPAAIGRPIVEGILTDSSPFAPIGRVAGDAVVDHLGQVLRPQVTNVNKPQVPDAGTSMTKEGPKDGNPQDRDVREEFNFENDDEKSEQSHEAVPTTESSLSGGPTSGHVTNKVSTEAGGVASPRKGDFVIPQSEIDDFLATIRGERAPGVSVGGHAAGSLSLRSEMPPSMLYSLAPTPGKAGASPQLKDTSLDQECTLFACSLRESPSRGRAHMNPIAKIFAGESDTYFCPIMEDE